MSAKEIFLLDMDETLFDFSQAEKINFLQTAEKFGFEASPAVFERFKQINVGLWQSFERGEITKDEIITGRFERLFGEFGIGANVLSAAYHYLDNFKNICIPYDGAVEFTAWLAERGRVYIVTNGNAECQRRHLKDGGLSPYITGVFISDELGCCKPTAEFARAVEDGIEGFEREKAVWIGDSVTSDKKCAEVAGVEFVLFAHNPPKDYSGLYATNYGDLKNILS